MASRSDYLGYAQTAADVLVRNWFGRDGPSVWVNQYPDFWRAPNAIIALSRLMQLTGQPTYMPQAQSGLDTFSYWFRPFGGYPLWYTDCAWWGNAFMNVHRFTRGFGTDVWTDMAADVYGDVWGGWDDTMGGGIWMLRNPRAYGQKAMGSVSTLLAMDLVGRFSVNYSGGTPPPEWYKQCGLSWSWLTSRALQTAAGTWYEIVGENGKPVGDPDLLAQAVAMGAMRSLFPHTPDVWAAKQAMLYADAAINNFTSRDGILQTRCEFYQNCTQADSDPTLFKGILVRYMAETVEFVTGLSMPTPQRYVDYIRNQADRVWANYPGRVYGMNWGAYSPNYQPTRNFLWDACLQVSALDLFVSAAAVTP